MVGAPLLGDGSRKQNAGCKPDEVFNEALGLRLGQVFTDLYAHCQIEASAEVQSFLQVMGDKACAWDLESLLGQPNRQLL